MPRLARLLNWSGWAEIAHQIGAIPLLWLALLAAQGKQRERQWFVLAFAFFISWLADSAADAGVNPWVMSIVFVVSQTALIGAVFLRREPAIILTMLITVAGCLAVAIQGVEGPDVILSTVAACAVILIVWKHPARKVRASLLVYFGLGQWAWIAHAIAVENRDVPMYLPTYFAYQGCRLVGILLFCYASWNVRPSLSLRSA